MVAFTKTSADERLWIAQPGSDDAGWVALVLGASAEIPASIDLSQALTDAGLLANILISAVVPAGWNDPAAFPAADAKTLVEQVDAILAGPVGPNARGIFWPADPTHLCIEGTADCPAPTSALGLFANGSQVNDPLEAPVVPQLGFQVSNSSQVAATSDAITIAAPGGGTGFIEFTGSLAPNQQEASTITQLTIPMTGRQRGTLQFSVALRRTVMHDKLRWGFQVIAPVPVSGEVIDKLAWLPLAQGTSPNATDMLGFDISLDPTDQYNQTIDFSKPGAGDLTRVYLAFTGQNEAVLGGQPGPTVLAGFHTTVFDYALELTPSTATGDGHQPARLVFTDGSKDAPANEGFVLGPMGDFVVAVPDAPDQQCYEVRCGLSGTESLSLQPGDTLRFLPNQPAYAQGYPFPQQSPVGPPPKEGAEPLEPTYLTSWATVLADPAAAAANVHYLSQPKGMNLYGKSAGNRITTPYPGMFGFEEVGYVLPQQNLFFPLFPYAGWKAPQDGQLPGHLDGEQLSMVETKAVAPMRRSEISGAQPPTSPSKLATLGLATTAAESRLTTTPTGLIVQVDGTGKYECLLLGQYNPSGTVSADPLCTQLCEPAAPGQMMGFCNPDSELQEAFQTNQMFLVVANADNLGTLAGYESPTVRPTCAHEHPSSQAKFQNSIRIQEWVTAACVGLNNAYDDYRSVMIVKGRKGKLTDLVANTEVWTQANTFGAPADVGTDGKIGAPDPGELPVLSLWLQKYLKAAQEQDSPYFEKFKAIISDENWTGILFLKATVADMPSQLTGLLGGINLDDFYVHHLGIEISPIKGTDIEVDGSSALFGLIYYVDPAFVEPAPNQPVEPVPPAPGDYDFKVLTLKVLFENAAVKDFESYAQLTLNEIFDQPVTRTVTGATDNPYNTIVLAGTYQHQNGQTFYVLDSVDDNLFYFDSNVLNKVEITKTQFLTVSQARIGSGANESELIRSRFDLWGFIDFKRVQAQLVNNDGEPVGCSPLDIFSYGSDYPESGGENCPGPQDAARRGLRFSALGIDMCQTIGSAQSPCAGGAARALTFDPSKIAFDPQQSTPREKSLVQEFALVLRGLVVGTKDDPPSKQGYLDVASDVRLGGVGGVDTWYGLEFQLNMGTPGEKAGKVGLTAGLIMAWAPGEPQSGGDYPVRLGLKLPGTSGGAPTISLEGVIKLSIGTIKLIWVEEQQSFLLNLYDIALKFLGLLKIPPNGTVAFYLFGSPDAQGDPSKLGWYAVYALAPSGKTEGSETPALTGAGGRG